MKRPLKVFIKEPGASRPIREATGKRPLFSTPEPIQKPKPAAKATPPARPRKRKGRPHIKNATLPPDVEQEVRDHVVIERIKAMEKFGPNAAWRLQQQQVLHMLVEGQSYVSIRRKLRLTDDQITQVLRRAMNHGLPDEDVELFRRMQKARYEAIYNKASRKFSDTGNPAHHRTMLEALTRIDRLFGLEKAKKLEIQTGGRLEVIEEVIVTRMDFQQSVAREAQEYATDGNSNILQLEGPDATDQSPAAPETESVSGQ